MRGFPRVPSRTLLSRKATTGWEIAAASTVTVKWADVDSIKVMRQDDSVKPALMRQGRMKLLGKTDLGDYSIDLDKVRSIAPAR